MSYKRLSYIDKNDIADTVDMNEQVTAQSDASLVRPSSFEDEAALGRRSDVKHFTKFSETTNLTAGAGEEIIWFSTDDFIPMTSAKTFTITYNSSTDGLGTTGALTILIDYIDSSGNAAQSLHTLGSDGSDTTSFTGLGINRAVVTSSGSADYNNNEIKFTVSVEGTQAVIPALASVTQQAIFFCDINSDAIAKFLWINTNKISGGGSPRITIKGYVFNRPIETRFEIFRVTIDTSSENTIKILEPVGFKLTPGDVLYFVADTDTNNAIVNLRFSLLEYRRS